MAKTNSERVEEIGHVVTELTVRVQSIVEALKRLDALTERLREELHAHDVRIAGAEREITELKKDRDEWGRRLWSLLVPVITAVVGGVVGYLLKR